MAQGWELSIAAPYSWHPRPPFSVSMGTGRRKRGRKREWAALPTALAGRVGLQPESDDATAEAGR